LLFFPIVVRPGPRPVKRKPGWGKSLRLRPREREGEKKLARKTADKQHKKRHPTPRRPSVTSAIIKKKKRPGKLGKRTAPCAHRRKRRKEGIRFWPLTGEKALAGARKSAT